MNKELYSINNVSMCIGFVMTTSSMSGNTNEYVMELAYSIQDMADEIEINISREKILALE